MKRSPLILVSPSIGKKGVEFGDVSISLSAAYCSALMGAGAIPFVMASTKSRETVAECVKRTDGVMLTGGDAEKLTPWLATGDLYVRRLPPKVRRTIGQTPDGGGRDFCELLIIDEVFRQRKPLLAICRGHQLLNVAFGGVLWADIDGQVNGALNHRQDDRNCPRSAFDRRCLAGQDNRQPQTGREQHAPSGSGKSGKYL